MGNLWLFNDLVSLIMSKNPVTDASIRTTTAVTIFNAGFKDNVVPGRASATVNHRLHPTDDIGSTLAHDNYVIGTLNYLIYQTITIVDFKPIVIPAKC
jgi:carboxypeptidase PM20D1